MNRVVLAWIVTLSLSTAAVADDPYLTSKGALKQTLRVECDLGGVGRDAGAAAAVRCGVWVEIVKNGVWTRGAILSIQTADKKKWIQIAAEATESGRLDSGAFEKIVASLRANDLQHLKSPKLDPKNRKHNPNEDAAYRITVAFGHRRHTAYLTASSLKQKQLTPEAKRKFENETKPYVNLAQDIFRATGIDLPEPDGKSPLPDAAKALQKPRGPATQR